MYGRLPILLGVVEPVAHDEAIFDGEADVIHLHFDLPPRRLAQQTRRPQRLRIARAEDLLQVVQRQAGIDDVLDDDDVAAFEAVIEVLDQAHFARRGRAAA